MAARLRVGILTTALLVGYLASIAVAAEFAACWVAQETVGGVGVVRTVTRCRIAGGEVVDYSSDAAVPSRLYPNAGTDLTGSCWYLTSQPTNWVYLSLFVDGDAVLGFDPDPSTPGGIALATDRIPRCTSEPNPGVDPAVEAWEYVMSYIHPPPAPEVSPPPGDGVTGMETFVSVPVPQIHEARLASGTGATLDIRIEVSGVEVEWGDGAADVFPPDPAALAGYPDGLARHVYETKDETGYDLSVSYAWAARWRVAGGDWVFLAVPDTTTTLGYPVAEVVSVLTD